MFFPLLSFPPKASLTSLAMHSRKWLITHPLPHSLAGGGSGNGSHVGRGLIAIEDCPLLSGERSMAAQPGLMGAVAISGERANGRQTEDFPLFCGERKRGLSQG